MCLDANDVSGRFRMIYMFLENILYLWTEGDCVPISVVDILLINRPPWHFSKRSRDLQIVQARQEALIRQISPANHII
jgi:hypothetical protein